MRRPSVSHAPSRLSPRDAEVDAVRAEELRPLLEWALSRYVRGHQGEVVLTLRRGQGMWTEEALSTGPVLQASVPQAPYEAFLRNQGEKLQAPGLSEEARREGFTVLKRMGNWLLLQPDKALEQASSSPLARYVLLPFVSGKVLKEAGEASFQRFALLTGRSLEVQVLSRVAAHLSPVEAREVERLMAAAAKGHTFTDEELRFLQRVARGLEAPLREAAEALRAGQKVPLLGARTLADGSRLLPGSPAHKAQRWLDYQFRHPEKYRHFSFQPDSDWERMYDKPYLFVEAKARQQLSLSGNLKAMIDYVEQYGGHLELWVRSSRHPDGPTRLSRPLLRRLNALEDDGKAKVMRSPP